MRRASQGFSLTELLIASVLGVIVLIAISRMDVSAIRIQQELFGRAQWSRGEEWRVALAGLKIAKSLEEADRVVIPDATNIQVRVFRPTTDCPGLANSCLDNPATPAQEPIAPCCFGNAANYQWDQYRRLNDGVTLRMFTDTGGLAECATAVNLASQVTGIAVAFRPDPLNAANVAPNHVVLSLTWNDGLGRSHVFQREVVNRSGTLYPIGAGLMMDSGLVLGGLTGNPALSSPPALCLG